MKIEHGGPITSFVKTNGWRSDADSRGWGNGYVVIPKTSPLFGIPYDDISVNVHGGLTFGEISDETGNWIIGFDTSHAGDTRITCTKQYVEEETERLRVHIENYQYCNLPDHLKYALLMEELVKISQTQEVFSLNSIIDKYK